MPASFWVFLVSAAIFATSYCVARVLLKRANVKPSHKGLLVGAVAGLGIVLLARVLKAFEVDLFRGTPQLVLQYALTVVFLAVPVYMMFVLMRSGPQLADLGPSPLQAMFLGLGVLLLLIGTGRVIAGSLTVGQGMVNLAQGILFLAIGLARIQIRSRGIYHSGTLLRWSRIERYEWSSSGTLTLALRRPRWWQDSVQLPVPSILVGRVDELMRLHVPTPA